MFNVGDLVMCLDDDGARDNVTKGSIYRVVTNRTNDDDLVYVLDDRGYSYGLFKFRFIKFEDIKVIKEEW